MNVIRIGTLSELTGEGTEYLLSSDRTQVIAHFFDGNFVRGLKKLLPEELNADTLVIEGVS